MTMRDGEPELKHLCSGLCVFCEHIGPDVVAILKYLEGPFEVEADAPVGNSQSS